MYQNYVAPQFESPVKEEGFPRRHAHDSPLKTSRSIPSQ
jgi:hypothetical protein